MKFPRLSNAFFFLSLEVGTKIIGWLDVVVGILALLPCVIVVMINLLIIFGPLHVDKNKDVPMEDDEEQRKRQIMAAFVLMGAPIIIAVFIASILMIYLIASIYLVLGAHKKRPGYMLFWIIINALLLFGSIGSMTLAGVVGFVINLYFMWVVISYYCHLKDNPVSYRQSGPGMLKLHGDEPEFVNQSALPLPPYSDGQK